MSALMVVNDSQLMLLEVAVEKLYMPWVDVFDAALMKKTVILFRMLDDEWSTLMPNRRDYRSYRGSNHETEYFYGGRSVLFAVPEAMLKRPMSGVDLQLYVYRGISKYFELEPQRNFGFTLVRVDNLLNGIIKDLSERQELEGYFSRDLEREPISRSTRGTFALLDDKLEITNASIELYVRISYLGKSIVTEVYTPMSLEKAFYAREESDEYYRYQFRELNNMDLESFCWGSMTILPPLHPDKLVCHCEIRSVHDQSRIQQTEEVEEETQTRKRRKRKRALDLASKLTRIQELSALMKEMRKNRPDIIPHGEGPKKVCPPSTNICPTVCPPVCVYTLPSACPNPCAPANICCLLSPC